MKVPSRATAVSGFVSVRPKIIIACPVCNAHVGQPCRKLKGYDIEYIKGYHVPRSAFGIAQAKKNVVTQNPEPVKKVKVTRSLAEPEGWGTGYGTNSGHGNVWKRPDYLKINCGGWRKCAQCKAHREYCIRYSVALGITDSL